MKTDSYAAALKTIISLCQKKKAMDLDKRMKKSKEPPSKAKMDRSVSEIVSETVGKAVNSNTGVLK